MASVVHHTHSHSMEVPARVYWAAGIGIAMLALLAAYMSMSANPMGAVAPVLTDGTLPFIPFVPML